MLFMAVQIEDFISNTRTAGCCTILKKTVNDISAKLYLNKQGKYVRNVSKVAECQIEFLKKAVKGLK